MEVRRYLTKRKKKRFLSFHELEVSSPKRALNNNLWQMDRRDREETDIENDKNYIHISRKKSKKL